MDAGLPGSLTSTILNVVAGPTTGFAVTRTGLRVRRAVWSAEVVLPGTASIPATAAGSERFGRRSWSRSAAERHAPSLHLSVRDLAQDRAKP
jgi:hypothetical protein